MKTAPPATAWIRALAAPYLRGYGMIAERGGSLRGYWFVHPGSSRPDRLKRRNRKARSVIAGAPEAAGFFVGYLLDTQSYRFLNPEPPECLVFASVQPVGGSLHRRLVVEPGSLLVKTFEYIRWLTHRPPRFVFHPDESAAMVRHSSMRHWPPAKYEHFSRNFFIETLAWLVRSGLVRKLREELLPKEGHRRVAHSRNGTRRGGRNFLRQIPKRK